MGSKVWALEFREDKIGGQKKSLKPVLQSCDIQAFIFVLSFLTCVPNCMLNFFPVSS